MRVLRRWWYLAPVLGAVFGLLTFSACSGNTSGPIVQNLGTVGTWTITATLANSTAPAGDYDQKAATWPAMSHLPTIAAAVKAGGAPPVGATITDSWTITQTNDGLSLQDSNGTLVGQANAFGAVFTQDTAVGIGGGNIFHAGATITCQLQPDGLTGGIQNSFYTLTTPAGSTTIAARETWTFTGVKK